MIHKRSDISKRHFLKAEFSINEIGKGRFFIGIAVGLCWAIVFKLFFKYCFGYGNLGVFVDDWSLDYELTPYIKLLNGYNSVGFAFCMTTFIWMSKLRATNRKKTSRHRMAAANSQWVFYAILYVLARLWVFIGNSCTNNLRLDVV